MPSESSNDPRTVAIEHLESLGLSAYAARTFVTLVSLGEGTARDVSDASDVPRTRVYDAIEELRSHGMVDLQHSTPKRFWAVSTETVGRHFEQSYVHRVNVLRESLDALESTTRSEEQRGVWTVTGRESVSERTVEFIDSASNELAYMTVKDLLTEDVTEALQRASQRGVEIHVAGLSQSVEEHIRSAVPQAELLDSMWTWSETPAGRLLMVDRKKTLVSVLTPNNSDSRETPTTEDETAIWGTGEHNSLVIVLKAMFTWQLTANSD